MIDYMKQRLNEVSTWKGVVALLGAILMYFTPDEIDKIIMMVLGALGITEVFTLEKKSQ